MTNQTGTDFGTEARRYFEPFVRGVERACELKGRTWSTVTADGRIGVFGLTRAEFESVSRRYGFGPTTPERLVASPDLQRRLAASLLSEYYRKAVRASWSQPNEARLRGAVELAAREWYADRERAAGTARTAAARPCATFVDVVTASLGLGRMREPIAGGRGDEGLAIDRS